MGTTTLGPRQTLIARMIMANGRSRGMGRQAAKIALMTALAESGLKMYANDNTAKFPGIEASLDYPHDAVGHDFDSLNYFQQRPSTGWGGSGSYAQQIRNLMTDDWAINAFYGSLAQRVPDYATADPGVAAQTVQRSAVPDAYAKWTAAADMLLSTYY